MGMSTISGGTGKTILSRRPVSNFPRCWIPMDRGGTCTPSRDYAFACTLPAVAFSPCGSHGGTVRYLPSARSSKRCFHGIPSSEEPVLSPDRAAQGGGVFLEVDSNPSGSQLGRTRAMRGTTPLEIGGETRAAPASRFSVSEFLPRCHRGEQSHRRLPPEGAAARCWCPPGG